MILYAYFPIASIASRSLLKPTGLGLHVRRAEPVRGDLLEEELPVAVRQGIRHQAHAGALELPGVDEDLWQVLTAAAAGQEDAHAPALTTFLQHLTSR